MKMDVRKVILVAVTVLAVHSCPPAPVELPGDVHLAALLNVHEPSGLLSCGTVSRPGLELWEGLRWAVGLLNQPLIPGVTFGLRALDGCGHPAMSLHHLSQLFPDVDSCPASSDMHNVTTAPFPIGVLDATGTTSQPNVADKIHRWSLPLVPLDPSNAVPPEYLAKILMEVAHDLEWRRVALLHADDEYSVRVVKTLGEIAPSSRLCIQGLGRLSATGDLQRTLARVTAPLLNRTGVLVIAPGDGAATRGLLELFLRDPSPLLRLQWLFSWIPPSDLLHSLGPVLNARTIFSLAPLPARVSRFEEYWANLTTDPTDDPWFAEYLQSSHPCSGPSCSPAEVLSRTSRVIPAIHAVLTLGHAYHKAWKDKCNSQVGLCSELNAMSRRDFLQQYLDPLEFQHMEGISPPEVTGRKSRKSGLGEIEDMKLSLTSYSFSNGIVVFNQVLSYDSRRSEVIEPNFVYVAALCDPEHVCSSCIKVRQGRGEDQETADGEDGSTAVLGSGAPLYVAVTVPLHEAGPGPLQCGPRLRPESVLALEATLWALRGLQVGAVVVDTCGSPLLAARRLLRHPQAVVAAISLGGPAETRAVAELMAPLNVTTVSAHRADRVLHVSPSQERISHAVLSTLRSAGWTHVALVHSSGEKDSAMVFQQLAEKEGICVATQVEINEFNNTREALDEVLRTRKRGVTAVVLWCNEADTMQFFHDVHHAANEGLVRPGDFAWLSAGDWGYHLDTIRGSETEALGALVFRPQMDEDPELVDYMKTLNPAHGGTSWLTELWNQEVHCTSQDPKCTGSLPAWGPLIWGAARAAGAVATGVVRLRREVCPQEQGLCPRLLRQPHLRELLAGAVRRSEVFTPSGHGEIPVDVFNLQMVPGNGFAYQKVGYYDHQLHQVANAATYGPDGSRKPLASRRSSCSDCGSCGHVETASFPSPDGIILVGVFPVHHRGALPFQCGALRDVSSVEAFLWALDAVNSDNSLGVKLGGLAIDSCSNRDKAYRDATNILSGKDTVTGLLVHQTSTELNPLAELAAPLGLPVILPLSVDISPQVSTSLVPLAPSHQELSSLVSSVLLRLQWTHVSLLTSAARQDLAQHFSTVADQAGIHLALMETIPTGAYDMSALVARVEDKQRRGARVVVSFLTSKDLDLYLEAMGSPRGTVLLHAALGDDLSPLLRHPEAALGALVLRPGSPNLPGLERHLRLGNATWINPWLHEACPNGPPCQLRTGPLPLATAQGVFAVARTLEELRRALCPPTGPVVCPQLREKLPGVLLPPLRAVTQYEVVVANYVRVGPGQTAFLPVGSFHAGQLALNVSVLRGYDPNTGRDIALESVRTFCLDCSPVRGPPDALQVNPKSGFVLATFLSVHEASDSGFFRCGNFSSPAALQSLAAVILALSRGPRNGVQLGARIMDFCGRKQLALERLFTLYQNSDPKSIIASLSFDMSAARELGPVLQSLQVPQITVASPSEPFALAPPATDQLQPLALFLKAFSWDYVYVIHSNDDYGSKTTKEFLKVANANGICLADYFTLPNEATSEVIIESFLGHLVDSQARVIVVIADDALKARRILQAAKVAKVLSKYVWVLNEVWDNDKYILNTIKDAPLDIFSVKTQGLVNKEFKESFSKLNLDNPGSIPKEWLEEFWQHNFHCQLPSSRVVQKQYSDICSRTEKLDVESMVQNRLVFQTIKSVEAVGEGLNRFLKRHCSLTVKNIEECGANARTELAKEIKSALECQDCKNSAGGQQIFQWKMAKDFHSSYVLSEIGLWNSGQWTYLKNATSLNYVLGKLPASTCTTEECGKCTNLIATQEALMVAGRDGVLSRLKTAWGVTITSLSVLGIFFVLVCTLYFLMSFPVSVGTTILGYMILMGVMALYGVNFAFLLAPPSEALFALGLAYSVVFSGMVIKVFNTWRRQRKNCEGMSPMGLLLQAVLLASVQGGIIALWLTLGGGTRSDVQEFAVALTYPGFLACIAALLAGVTWWDRESRWMLACCGLTAAVWSSWGLAVWGLGHVARPAVAANLVCATGVMLCLYLRKVYLYSKLSRDREMKMRLQPSSPNPASLYGTLHDNLSPVLFGSQATLNNNSTKKIFGSRSKVREDDARSDSSGSVQVQGTDLYPLDMYDGGSQFQPYRHRDTDTLPFAR